MFLNGGKKGIVEFLKQYAFVAIGDGTSPVQATDTKLDNERFRKAVTDIYSIDNKVIVEIFVDTLEANFDWKEIGLFVGGSAGEKDSGTLYNRALIEEEKNDLKTTTISWEVSVL